MAVFICCPSGNPIGGHDQRGPQSGSAVDPACRLTDIRDGKHLHRQMLGPRTLSRIHLVNGSGVFQSGEVGARFEALSEGDGMVDEAKGTDERKLRERWERGGNNQKILSIS